MHMQLKKLKHSKWYKRKTCLFCWFDDPYSLMCAAGKSGLKRYIHLQFIRVWVCVFQLHWMRKRICFFNYFILHFFPHFFLRWCALCINRSSLVNFLYVSNACICAKQMRCNAAKTFCIFHCFYAVDFLFIDVLVCLLQTCFIFCYTFFPLFLSLELLLCAISFLLLALFEFSCSCFIRDLLSNANEPHVKLTQSPELIEIHKILFIANWKFRLNSD